MEKLYSSTKFINVSRVKETAYPVYFTGNMADSAAVHRNLRKKYRPVWPLIDLTLIDILKEIHLCGDT